MEDVDFIKLAVEKANAGLDAGQHPYGSAISRNGELICCEHNLVIASGDPTAHAEVVAIRRASQILGTNDLSECKIYSTCEPCVMCFGACYWSGFSAITYGASIDDKAAFGLVDPGLKCIELNRACQRPAVVTPGVGRDLCVELFRRFVRR